jgi:hypothetical protein
MPGGGMIDDMGIFRTTLGVAALSAPYDRRELSDGPVPAAAV